MSIHKFNEYAEPIPLYDEIDEDVRHQIKQMELDVKDDGHYMSVDYYQPHHSESKKEECQITIQYSYSKSQTSKYNYQQKCIGIERRLHALGADRVSARVASTEKYQDRSMKHAGNNIGKFNFDSVTWILSWNPTDPISYLNEASLNNKNDSAQVNNILNIARDEGLWVEFLRKDMIAICNTDIGLKDPKPETQILPIEDYIKICENLYTRINQFYDIKIEYKTYTTWEVHQSDDFSKCDEGTYMVFFSLS